MTLATLLAMPQFDPRVVWGNTPLLIWQDPDRADLTINTPPGGTSVSTGQLSTNPGQLVRPLAPGCLIAPLVKSNNNPFTGQIMVGRARNNDIQVFSPHVSKVHAWFVVPQKGPWQVADHDSVNGTSVNLTRLRPHEPAFIQPGDTINFGPIPALFLEPEGLQDALDLLRELEKDATNRD